MNIKYPNLRPRQHCGSRFEALTFRSALRRASLVLGLAALLPFGASAQVVAGWDTWDSGTAPTVSVLADGVTATAVATGEGGNWTTADTGTDPGRGSSGDGTWGTFNVGALPSTVTNVHGANLTLTNGKVAGQITFTIVNDGAVDLELEKFRFDALAFRPNAARTYALNVLEGSDISVGNVFTSEEDEITHIGGNAGLLASRDAHDDIDLDLTGLADSTLEVGGTAIIQLAFSDGSGSGGGHHLFLDNVALTTASTITDKLVVTSVPVSATAGEDFEVTVQAQDSGGSPLNVTEDTTFTLFSSGMGVLSPTTGTILMGTNSVTLTTVQSTVAETITLTALKSSGDDLLPSVASDPIEIIAGPATQIIIETAADGSGTAVGDTIVLLGAELDVFANSRDAVGNFIANETAAVFSLVNITGEVSDFDLLDNEDGSANFLAQDIGTCNIRATVSGFPDADSGLISAEELTARWTRGAGNSSWSSSGNWLGDTVPAFDDQTDLIFYDAVADDAGLVNVYIATDRTARSLTYNKEADANFNIRTTVSGTTGVANLTFDTDSLVDPAEIIVDADATGNFKLGNIAAPDTREHGDVVLADELLITHNGTGTLNIDATISETGGSYGITKAGPGTLALTALNGANTYTGTTTVNGGILVANGDSVPAALVIDGGIVEVTGTEYVSSLRLGAGPVLTSGTYDAASDPDHISGAGLIIVGTPPSGSGIVITKIERTGISETTLTFTSAGNVDVYGSTATTGFVWSLYDSDQPSGTYVDSLASGPANYYFLVPAGDPAPADGVTP